MQLHQPHILPLKTTLHRAIIDAMEAYNQAIIETYNNANMEAYNDAKCQHWRVSDVNIEA